MQHNYALIMAGGVGSRFWPISTATKPKQFLDILGIGKTLLQLTYERILKFCPPENIYVVTSDEYVNLVIENIPDLAKNNILSEPQRRNTAPCVAYGCYKIYDLDSEAKILVAPSDHLIMNEDKFSAVIKDCFEATKEDILITLGIETTRPEIGYGYIQSKKTPHPSYSFLEKVKTFTEKPDKELAEVFYQNEAYYWNSGMFVWSAKAIVQSFKELMGDLDALFKLGFGIYNTKNERNFVQKTYLKAQNISIDYAILEKASNVYVHPCDISWTDLGTWGSLYTKIKKNEQANALVGENISLFDCKNSIINNTTKQLVVAQGLDDYIVVNTADILLICKKADEQKIKEMVATIAQDKKLKHFV